MNKAIILGRITKELEVTKTQSGKSCLHFYVAVRRNFKNGNGEYDTDFISVIAYGNTADNINKFFGKGDRIGIIGEIRTGSYENRDGKKVYTTDVLCENFEFVDAKKDNAPAQEFEEFSADDELPF